MKMLACVFEGSGTLTIQRQPRRMEVKTSLALMVLSLAPLAATAGTSTLPEPSLAQITGISNLGSETPNDLVTVNARQTITGWSADGTQLYAVTAGTWAYGYRGSRHATWCGTLRWTITFDSNGNPNPIGTATYTSGNTLCSQSYYTWNTSATVYNAVNYGATVETVQDEFSPTYYLDVATLLTP